MGMSNIAYLFYGLELSVNSKLVPSIEDMLEKQDELDLIFLGYHDPPDNHGNYFLTIKKSIISGIAKPVDQNYLQSFDSEYDETLLIFCQENKIKVKNKPQWWIGSCFCV